MRIKRHAFQRMVSRFGDVPENIIAKIRDVLLLGNFRSYDEVRGTCSYEFEGKVYVLNVKRDILVTVWKDE